VKANWSINYPGRACMGADPLSVSRDGQRLRFDVFKELRTGLQSSSRSAPPAGRSPLAGRARFPPMMTMTTTTSGLTPG
jgi:hypothetical protein